MAESARPLAIAHRAGNEPHALERAEDLGVDYIEADLWPFHGRVEVRHLKTIGFIPLYWDRWYFERPFRRYLRLEQLIERASPESCLLFDLKGRNASVSRSLLHAMARHPGRRFAVCSQWWHLLAPFHGHEATEVFFSVGNERALRRLPGALERHPGSSVSIHRNLLDPPRVAEIRSRAGRVVSWPVNDIETYRQLRSLGVDGFISDEQDVLAAIVRDRETAAGRLESPS